MNGNWLETALPWLDIILTIIFVLVPISIGQRLGIAAHTRSKKIAEAPVGSVVGASLGLLAFMLAFTFQIVANKYDARKQLLLDDIAEIRSVYHLASLLPEPYHSDAQKIILHYIDNRVKLAKDPKYLKQALTESEKDQRSLWKICEELSVKNNSSEIFSLFTASVNELANIHNKRVAVTLLFRIPKPILYALYFIAFFSMLILGFQFGISGVTNQIIKISMALTFGAVMWLIISLDNPETGMIKLNNAPLFKLQEQLLRNNKSSRSADLQSVPTNLNEP